MLVDHDLERSPAAAGFRLQSGSDVVIERESGAYLMKLHLEHHDA
jgi:hypothetical protein